MIPSIPSGLCCRWGFLVLAPVSCGIARGWLRRQGPQRLMMDSKTRWQLWNNDPGRDRGNCGLGAIQNTIVWFPIFDGDTVERKMQLDIPSDTAAAWSLMIFRHHKGSCKVVSWTMWSSGSHSLWKSTWQVNKKKWSGECCIVPLKCIHLLNEWRKSYGVFESLKVLFSLNEWGTIYVDRYLYLYPLNPLLYYYPKCITMKGWEKKADMNGTVLSTIV